MQVTVVKHWYCGWYTNIITEYKVPCIKLNQISKAISEQKSAYYTQVNCTQGKDQQLKISPGA